MPKKVNNMVTTENEIAPTPPSVEPTLTIDEQIKHDYIHGLSPLQCALKHNVEVDHVLVLIGQQAMLEVHLVGDQVDSAGPGVPLNYGTAVRVPYTKN